MKNFEPLLLAEIENKGKLLNFKEGEKIIHIGQIIKNMPLIVSGTIRVCRLNEEGYELLLYYVQANESCAMTFTCCMQQFPSEIMAIAEDDVTLIAVPIELMDVWLNKYSSWKNFVMNTIHFRFNELLKTIDQIAFKNLDERLIIYLKEKSRTTGSKVIKNSHEQIALELATSRVVISRMLKKLESDKKLILYRNEIKIMKEL
jgi:CRP/FNR family transcriptional regulator